MNLSKEAEEAAGSVTEPEQTAVKSNHTLDVVEEGGLEPITKPSTSNKGQTGSRAPSTRGQAASRAFGTATSQRNNFRQTWSSIAPSLEILSPEEIMEHEMLDLEIEDFGDMGADLTDNEDEEGDTERYLGNELKHLKSREASSLFHMAEPNIKGEESVNGEDWEQDSDYSATRQISMLEREAGESEVDSEEENDIMREIKDEIKRQVKEEMVEELSVMKRRIEKESGVNESSKEDDLANVDPELKVAILKMRKLDRILAKKEKKEKQVKKERILLEARLKRELEEIKPEDHEEIKEVKVNTSKYLALTLPASHNLGIRLTNTGELEEDMSPPVTPVFKTQVFEESHNNPQAAGTDDDRTSETVSEDGQSDRYTSEGRSTQSGISTSSGRRKSKKNKDFIKRNIQLAAEAGESVAMTDDEKKRIADLLIDLDEVPEVTTDKLLLEDNPYQIVLSDGDGFHPSEGEVKRLEDIDRRLKALMPREDYESIASPSPAQSRLTQHTVQSSLFIKTHNVINVDEPGEVALKETKEHRDLSQRLKDVENQLKALTNPETLPSEDGRLTSDTLNSLLDDCVQSLSRCRLTDQLDDSDSQRSLMSSQQSLLENPPHLPRDILEQLLAEAQRTDAELRLENGRSTTPSTGTNPSRTGTPNTGTNLSKPSIPNMGTNPNKMYKTGASSIGTNPNRTGSATTGTSPFINNINTKVVSGEHQILESHIDHQTLLNKALHDVQQHFYNSPPSTANSMSSSRPSTGETLTRPGSKDSRPNTGDTLRSGGSTLRNSNSKGAFLPAIDPKGMLTNQRRGKNSNNNSSVDKQLLRSNSRPKMKSVWNSVESEGSVVSQEHMSGDQRMPRPPSTPSSGGGNNDSRTSKRTSSTTVLEDVE